MGFGPAYGTGTGGGAVDIFVKKDGNPAIFANTGARDTYFTTNPDELAKVKTSGDAIGIGTANQITAAYIYKQNAWQPIATNFKGDKGATGNAGADGAPGKGIDPSKLTDKSIPIWDNTLQTFVDSGVSSPDDGSIKMSPNSLEFGLHTMSSAIEDVTFTNSKTGKNYSPVWQELKPGSTEAWMRIVEAQETVIRVPTANDDVTNPMNTVTIDADEVFLGGTFTLTNAATNVIMEFHDYDTKQLVWHYDLGDLAAGQHDITFSVPFKVFAGYQYDVSLKSHDGDVVAKGSGTNFSWTIQRAKFTDHQVASQDWVNNIDTVDDVTSSGNLITVTKRDGTTSTITLPTNGGGTTPTPTDIFRNKVQPVHFSADLTPANQVFLNQMPYFILDNTAVADATLNLINIGDLNTGDEVAAVVANQSATYNILVTPAGGQGSAVSVSPGKVLIFLSSQGTSTWSFIDISVGTSTGGTTPTGVVVKDIASQSNGKELLVTYSDNTNTTISIDAYASDITALNTAITKLQRKITSKTKFFVYKGSTVPTLPTGSRGGYYLTFFGQNTNLTVVTPNSVSTIGDGTIFFVDNNSDQHLVTITPGKQGDTINGGASMDINPESVAWFAYNQGDWQELYSGYLPQSYKHLLTDIKSDLLKDNSFITDVRVQGDDPNTVLDCTSLKFPGCTVAADPQDQKKGVINIPSSGSGSSLSITNPDGTIYTDVERIKLVGMELKADPSGIYKLYVLDKQNIPTPVDTSAYAFFDASSSTPDSVAFNNLPVFRGGRVTLHKDTDDGQYAYILLPPGEGTDTERIGELGGLPAYWSKESKDYTFLGQTRTYTVFRSPYPFHERDITLVLYP